MDYSRIGELVSEHRTSHALRGRLASLEKQRTEEEDGEIHVSRGIGRAIRMTKAAINRAEIMECIGTKNQNNVNRYMGYEHFGLEEVRYRPIGSAREGKLYYVILAVKEGVRTKFLVLSTNQTKHPGFPNNVKFDYKSEALLEARTKADELGRKNAEASRYSSTRSITDAGLW